MATATITGTTAFRAELAGPLAGATRRITEHRFYRALRDGSLPELVRAHFAGQDLHLLPGYGRACARAAGSADDHDTARFLAGMAATCLDNAAADATAARTARPDAESPPAGPTTVSYLGFLAASTAGPPAAALGALLPSAYLQLSVNDDLLARVDPVSRYAGEIRDGHPGDGYRTMVDRFLDLVVRFGERRCAEERAALIRHLHHAVHYELAFVEAAWRLETWPAA